MLKSIRACNKFFKLSQGLNSPKIIKGSSSVIDTFPNVSRPFVFVSTRKFRQESSVSSTGEMSESRVDAEHDAEKKIFFITLPDGKKTDVALLQYDWLSPAVVDLYHTEVPEVFRGRGIAKHLAQAALDHFLKEGIRTRLTCTYLQKYAKENATEEMRNNVDPIPR